MSGALSTSKWKWTWWFLLLAGVSAAVFLVTGVIGGALGVDDASTIGAIGFVLGLLCVVGVVVGVIGAVVTFVMTLLRRHSPPAQPVA